MSRYSGGHADTRHHVDESRRGAGRAGRANSPKPVRAVVQWFASAATQLQLQQDLQFGANHQCVASQVVGPGTQILQRNELGITPSHPLPLCGTTTWCSVQAPLLFDRGL